jgi:threonine aldolase
LSEIIDFRSDFVSRPTDQMIEAMMIAAKLPSGFGLRENQVVSELEALAAKMMGKQDALFVPTCMMANQIAISLRCTSGDKFITEENAHVITSEMNAASLLTGAIAIEVSAKNGSLELEAIENKCASFEKINEKPKLIVIENSHVRSGGRVVSLEHMQSIAALGKKYDVPIHLDGARIFNAAVAIGCPVTKLTCCAETVALNLNKGLAAPLGAILAGPKTLIKRAAELRQLFGGGWRPAAIPAAAGIVALKTMTDRLGQDSQNAKKLAAGISNIDGIQASLENTETNIVLARPMTMTSAKLTHCLAQKDILVLSIGNQVRWVTHYEINELEINIALCQLKEILQGG